jgi:hypothetical protein
MEKYRFSLVNASLIVRYILTSNVSKGTWYVN